VGNIASCGFSLKQEKQALKAFFGVHPTLATTLGPVTQIDCIQI
jgi:hypothetical protein